MFASSNDNQNYSANIYIQPSLQSLHFSLFYSQAHYIFCHKVLNTYVDNFDTYANFKEVV